MGSDLTWSAMYTLKTIDEWIGVINGNMAGSARIGFKGTRIVFGGGTTDVTKPPGTGTVPTLGIQIAEREIKIKDTGIDWAQGSLIASVENTHLAINGKGFFVLSEPDADGRPVAGSKIYLTRDGEFHWNYCAVDDRYRLYNKDGLVLLDINDVNSAAGVVEPGADGVDSVHQVIPPNDLDGEIKTSDLGIALLNDPDNELRFSGYGSTVFELKTPASSSLNILAPDNDPASRVGSVFTHTLEASNAEMTNLVPELTMSQKLYQAFSKVVQVGMMNIDSSLGLIR